MEKYNQNKFYQGLRKVWRPLAVSLTVPLLVGTLSGCIGEPRRGTHQGHNVTITQDAVYRTTVIEGKKAGFLRAADEIPFGSIDNILLINVSEADSLYRFNDPEILEEITSEIIGEE